MDCRCRRLKAESSFRSKESVGSRFKSWAGKNKVLIGTAGAILLGVCLGLALRPAHLSLNGILWIKLWGELFLRMIKVIMLPMIMSCIVVGLSNLGTKATGRIGAATLIWVFSTQIIAVILGLVLTAIIHPGHNLGGSIPKVKSSLVYTDVFADFLRNLFPDNIVQACLQHAYTERSLDIMILNMTNASGGENSSETYEIIKEKTQLMYRSGVNTMGIVTFSILLGFGIQAAGKRAKPLADVFDSIYHVVFKIMGFIIWYSPIGICSLIMGALLEVENLSGAITAIGLFVLTVVTGLFIHQVIILPTICFVLCRRNPFRVIWQFMDGILAGSAAATSMVALPYFLRDSQTKVKIDHRVANFAMPIFAAINRDGSALFICVSAIFVAQTYDVSVIISQYFLLGILVTLLCAAVVAVPSASIVVLLMVTEVINVPIGDRLGLLLATEWFLDRLRASTNLECHGLGLVVIDHFCRKSLDTEDITNDPLENHINLTVIENEEEIALNGKAEQALNGKADHF